MERTTPTKLTMVAAVGATGPGCVVVTGRSSRHFHSTPGLHLQGQGRGPRVGRCEGKSTTARGGLEVVRLAG